MVTMGSKHSLLARQLRKYIGNNPMPDEFWQFVSAVNAAYDAFDSDRLMLERSLDLSSQELLQAYSEQKKMTEALLSSEERYRAIFENASEAIFIVEAEGEQAGKIVSANPAAAALHGYTLDELLALFISDIDAPEDALRVEDRIRRIMQGEWINEEIMHRRKDGSVFPVDLNVGVFELNGCKYILGFGRDITTRKATEAALQESERRFREMLQSLRLISLTLDRTGRITFCNAFLLNLTGWSETDVIGKDWFEIFPPPANTETYRRSFERSVREGTFSVHNEGDILTRKGEVRNVSWSNTILRNPLGEIIGTASIGEDITERRKLEEQLRQSQKMEAVGQLAGGIAHDFNNILTATIGYSHLLLSRLSQTEQGHYYAEQILSSAEKAANLTQGLLAFSRKQTLNPRPIDINAVVAGMHDLLSRLLPEDIDLGLDLANGELVSRADRGQLEQVLMNLVTNARDAIKGGGHVSIRTESTSLDAEFERIYGYGEPGDYVVVSVSDTGVGIADDIQQHIFEPFYTTKGIGEGTGLGLSVVYGIVRQHGGFINLYSVPDEGTTFKVYLPLVNALAAGSGEYVISAPEGGAETILVIEDSAEVLDIIRHVLEEYGYSVITAIDGEDGIEKFRQIQDSLSLVICDVIMPKKSGKEVYEAIKAMSSDAKVLFTSGYTADIIAKKGILEDGLDLVRKPVAPHELLRKVREILDRAAPGGGE